MALVARTIHGAPPGMRHHTLVIRAAGQHLRGAKVLNWSGRSSPVVSVAAITAEDWAESHLDLVMIAHAIPLPASCLLVAVPIRNHGCSLTKKYAAVSSWIRMHCTTGRSVLGHRGSSSRSLEGGSWAMEIARPNSSNEWGPKVLAAMSTKVWEGIQP